MDVDTVHIVLLQECDVDSDDEDSNDDDPSGPEDQSLNGDEQYSGGDDDLQQSPMQHWIPMQNQKLLLQKMPRNKCRGRGVMGCEEEEDVGYDDERDDDDEWYEMSAADAGIQPLFLTMMQSKMSWILLLMFQMLMRPDECSDVIWMKMLMRMMRLHLN